MQGKCRVLPLAGKPLLPKPIPGFDGPPALVLKLKGGQFLNLADLKVYFANRYGAPLQPCLALYILKVLCSHTKGAARPLEL
jgi:hypothetical protein